MSSAQVDMSRKAECISSTLWRICSCASIDMVVDKDEQIWRQAQTQRFWSQI